MRHMDYPDGSGGIVVTGYFVHQTFGPPFGGVIPERRTGQSGDAEPFESMRRVTDEAGTAVVPRSR